MGLITLIEGKSWDGSKQHEIDITFSSITVDNGFIDVLEVFIKEQLLKYEQLVLTVYNNELESLSRKYNGRTRFSSKHFGLSKENLDVNQLNESIRLLNKKNSHLDIRFFDSVPNEYLKDWCDIFNETSKDMPDEKEEAYIPYHATVAAQLKSKEVMKEHNLLHYCYMIFNENNEAIAESNLRIDNKDPRFPYQFMIGVKKEYRGLGLGKWMQTSMYKKLYETTDFEKVEVVHHTDNNSAIAISEFIGFEFMYSLRSSCISLTET